jgi:hypothetical protein
MDATNKTTWTLNISTYVCQVVTLVENQVYAAVECSTAYTLVEMGVGLVLYSLIKSKGKAKKPTPKNKVKKNQPKKAKKAIT